MHFHVSSFKKKNEKRKTKKETKSIYIYTLETFAIVIELLDVIDHSALLPQMLVPV